LNPSIPHGHNGHDAMARPSLPVFVLNITGRTRETVSAVLFFLVILLVVYLPSFSGVWVYDDFPNIVANENVHPKVLDFSSLIQSFYWTSENPDASEKIQRPLAYLSFAVNWYVGEDRVFGYHVVNFIIHLTSACFLYLFIRSTLVLPTLENRYLSNAHWIAFLSVLIWAMHPIQVTAVTYIVQRMASMAGMFIIICLYFYLKGRTSVSTQRRVACFIVSGAGALCAFGTKENSAILPITIFLYEVLLVQGVERFNFKKMIVWGLAAGALVAVIGLFYVDPMTILNGFDNRPYTPIERVLTESRVILTYLRLLFYPLLSEFTLVHDVVVSTSLWAPWTTLASILTLVGLILFSLLWLAKRQAIIAFAILFFFFNHAIEGSFIALELIYEHRNYVPSMFIFLIPAMLVLQALRYFSDNRKIQYLAVFSGILILSSIGHSTYAYNGLFKNSLLLWADNVRKSPGLSVVHNNYGIQLMQRGFYDRALASFKQSIQLDRYFNLSQRGLGHYNLGIYYETVVGDHQLALACYREAIDRAFNSRKMWQAMSMSLLYNGQPAQAADAIRQALRQWPDDPDFMIAEAKLKMIRKAFDQALEIAGRVRRQFPEADEPLALMGEIYRQAGNVEKAIHFWSAYRDKNDGSYMAELALADLYGRTGNSALREQALGKLDKIMAGRNWGAWLTNVSTYMILSERNLCRPYPFKPAGKEQSMD
jgi:tetratricopeptide (TPR) repeat protein